MQSALRVCLGLRCLRMLRLLASINRANVLFRHFVKVLPAFSSLFGAFWAVFVLYAQLGCTGIVAQDVNLRRALQIA